MIVLDAKQDSHIQMVNASQEPVLNPTAFNVERMDVIFVKMDTVLLQTELANLEHAQHIIQHVQNAQRLKAVQRAKTDTSSMVLTA